METRHLGSSSIPRLECTNRRIGRWAVRYDYQEEEDGNISYQETVIDHKPTLGEIKDIVLSAVNALTAEKIINGFVWDGIKVWLSTENQFNFKAACDLAVQLEGINLPITFKLGENENGDAIYHTFFTVGDLQDFYVGATAYINECLSKGWQKKDAIDWSVYEEAL